MNNVVISFIIPAHNAEKTLTQAVYSIGFHPLVEIIIVENTSSDKTLKTAQELAAKHSQITVYQSESGVSNARNKGIEKAHGSWLAFVDADDWMLPGATETMLADAGAERADVILYGHEAGSEKRAVAEHYTEYCGSRYDQGRAYLIDNPTRYMQVWAKLFKRQLIIENQIHFNPALRLSEDSDFTLHYLKIAKSIFLSPDLVYHYRLSSGSTMRTFDGTKAKAYVAAMYESEKAVKNDTEIIQYAFQKYILMHLNILMVHEVFSQDNPQSEKEKIALEKSICQEPIFMEALRSVSFKDIKSVRLFLPFLLKHGLYYLASIGYSLRAKQNTVKEIKNG